MAGAAGGLLWWLRRRGVDPRLLPTLLRTTANPAPPEGRAVHLLLCVADHYEPLFGRPPQRVARARVARWLHDYPRQFARFRDSDGFSPRHTFFYPLEEYEPEYLDALAELCRQGFGEVEVHLHHDRDTAENLRRTLSDGTQMLAEQHGLLACRRASGTLAYGFIHGNWALCNARPDGRWCGVNNELDILRETGCYADFTMPSAPHPTQTRTINSIYYARTVSGRSRSHDFGQAAGFDPPPTDGLLMIQGPLLLDWARRKWGLLPRLENGCLQASQPPSDRRIDLWLRAGVQVPQRPDWYFVKLHAHGAPENAHETLLGESMVRFHEALAERAEGDPLFRYHYVTAREMYNLARAAEAGWSGSVAGARDHELLWNGDSASRFDRRAVGVPSRADDAACADRLDEPAL